MEENILAGIVTLAFLATLGRQLFLAIRDPTPGGAVLLTSSTYLIGATIVGWRMDSEMSSLVYTVCTVLFLAYLVGYFGCSTFFRLRQKAPDPGRIPQNHRSGRGTSKWFFLLVTLSGCVAVVYATGTDRLLAALYQFVVLGDSPDSVLGMRMALASGEEGWMAPGYVKQLRDILMPLSGLLVLFAIRRKPGRFVFLSFVLVPVIALLMISSGERGSVLLFLAAVYYGAARTVRGRILSATVVLGPLTVAFLIAGGTFFALTSSFTSRQYEDSTAFILADRVVTRTPEENVLGGQAWHRGAPFPGAGWVSELASVLPGTQKTISNLIHEDLGGGNLGNSVLGMWIDIYYNFGWLLGLIAAFMVGVSMAFFNHWVNTKRARSWSADICGLWLSICMLMVLSPFGFLLYGPFLLSAVLWVIPKSEKWNILASLRNPPPAIAFPLNPGISLRSH